MKLNNKILVFILLIVCTLNSCFSNRKDEIKSFYFPINCICKTKVSDLFQFATYKCRDYKINIGISNSQIVYINNESQISDQNEWFELSSVYIESWDDLVFLGSDSSNMVYLLVGILTEEEEKFWVAEIGYSSIQSLGTWRLNKFQMDSLMRKDPYFRLTSQLTIKKKDGKIDLFYTDDKGNRILTFLSENGLEKLIRNPNVSNEIDQIEKTAKLKNYDKIIIDLDYSEGVYDKETIEINWNKRLVKFKKNNATKSQNEFLHQNIYFRNDTLVISHTSQTYIADYFFTYKPEYDDVLMVKISLYLKCNSLGSTMKNYKVDFFDMGKYHQSLSGLRDLDEENYLHVFQRLFSYKDFYFHFADSSGSKFSNPYSCEIYPTEMEIALMSKSLINKNNIDSFIFLVNSCYNIYKGYFKQRSNSFYLKDVLYNARIILYQINLIDDKNYKSFLLLADICWDANQKLESISAYKQYINLMKEIGEQDSVPKYILERIKND